MEKETYAVARTRARTGGGAVTGLRLSPYAMCLTQTTRLNMLPLAAEVETMTENEMEKEAQVLTPKRTEFGKAVRKAYEGGELDMSRHDMTELEPREDGISNTLTSVQKDNIVMEKDVRICAMRGRGGEDGGVWEQTREYNDTGASNTLTSVAKDNIVEQTEAVAYDDYNGRFVPGNVTNALTTNIGSGAERNGQKVMITEEERARIESEGWEWNEERGIYTRLRFRKFTPRECFRLMDVTESDIDRIQAAGISECQQYKMAGNSIVVACLAGIFRNLFFPPENKETLF